MANPRGTRSLSATVDLQAAAEPAFSLLCSIEKWPLWLSFLRSAKLTGEREELGPGAEVLVRSSVPGEPEQLFEVDHYITNHQVSLVGAYSVRRRLEFRLERKSKRCKLHARVEYPAYGGRAAMLWDALRSGRRLAAQLDESLQHFKHLVEFRQEKDALLADF